MSDNIHKIGDLVYPCLLNIVETYQANYTGDDKMSREFMMGEIEKFKTVGGGNQTGMGIDSRGVSGGAW